MNQSVLENGPEVFWGWLTEGRTWWQENAYGFDPKDQKARDAYNEYGLSVAKAIMKGGLGQDFFSGAYALTLGEDFDKAQNYVKVWAARIKNALDPENQSDHAYYVAPEYATKYSEIDAVK